MGAAREYAQARSGSVSFAVRSEGRLYGWRATRSVPSASVLKAMLLVAYLRRPGLREPLAPAHRRLLEPMVRWSDNATATRLFGIVGTSGLVRLARRAGMSRFRAAAPIWGHSRIDAADATRFFLRIDSLVPAAHRAYAMRLLSSIVPSQRWGIGSEQPAGWALYFKGGWGSGTGAVDHQVALLRRGRRRVAIAVMTTGNPSHAYGKETLRGLAARLLRGLGR